MVLMEPSWTGAADDDDVGRDRGAALGPLPIRRGPASTTTRGDGVWEHRGVPPSVLVVDDDACFRGMVSALLADWGYVVVGEAGTATEALACAGALRPAVALVDVGLPDGDGFTLSRRLRELPAPPRVVLISADAWGAGAGAARRAGATGFLAKDQLSDRALRPLVERA
jgi:CheY-like chemotaxis protein